MPKIIDITGQTFGRLTVLGIARHGSYPGDHIRWRCRCSCGGDASATAKNLRKGHTKSCGCWRSDNWFIQKQTHGQSHTRLHRIWRGMKTRCGNPNCKAFPRYGGRGIRVCTDWIEFEPFRDWAITNGYADNLAIDRYPDNDGGYEPNNCRWTTYSGQRRNSSQPIRAVVRSDGRAFQCVSDAAQESGTTTSAIASAIKRSGFCAGFGWRYA